MTKQIKKNKMKKKIGDRYKVIGVVAIILALLFLFLLCGVLNILAQYLTNEDAARWHLYVEGTTLNWFSVFESYSGVLVTIVLGVITLRLTVELGESDKKRAKLQNELSIATNMPNMKCEDMRIYCLDLGDRPYEIFNRFTVKNKYLLYLEMSPAFPAYFKINLSKMKLRSRNQRSGAAEERTVELQETDYRIINNEKFRLMINVPTKDEEIFEQIYYLSLLSTGSTSYDKTLVDIYLRLSCENILVEEKEGNVEFDMHFLVRNVGRAKTAQGVSIEVLNREMLRV